MTATQSIEDAASSSTRSSTRLAYVAAIGAAVALSLGLYGSIHDPAGQTTYRFGFDRMLAMKAWFATGGAVLALWQVTTAAWMWGRLPGVAKTPDWVPPTHRWSATLAFLLTLPVAYHCLWSLGFQDTNSRVLAHSLLGCAFYGAFATKMLALRTPRLPSHTLPVVGGLVSVLLVGIWLTSARWYFQTVGFPGL